LGRLEARVQLRGRSDAERLRPRARRLLAAEEALRLGELARELRRARDPRLAIGAAGAGGAGARVPARGGPHGPPPPPRRRLEPVERRGRGPLLALAQIGVAGVALEPRALRLELGPSRRDPCRRVGDAVELEPGLVEQRAGVVEPTAQVTVRVGAAVQLV